MRVNLFAQGDEFLDTISILEELGFFCKENPTDTSAICLNYDEHMVLRLNQLNDTDRDGVSDGVDCRPYDPAFQDILAPQIGELDRTLDGYKLDDYYFHNGKWHIRNGAKPVFKGSRFGFKKKRR